VPGTETSAGDGSGFASPVPVIGGLAVFIRVRLPVFNGAFHRDVFLSRPVFAKIQPAHYRIAAARWVYEF
ncbi:hypothetical protein, partial [Paraburkholderia sediminicola]|uniref:hypothetical protein n=1 Tax=Paraburkholderia sediminicola TaxID=458836 RepID=UPI0038B8EF10